MVWISCPAVNGIEPRNLVTLGSCPRFLHAGRQYRQPRHGERLQETRGRRPIRVTHYVIKEPVRSQLLLFGVESNHVATSMRTSRRSESANGTGKSDSRIVPQQPTCQVGETKPGNSGGGKAAKLSRERDRTPAGLSVGNTVNQRLDRITQRAEQQPEEVFNNLYSLLTYDFWSRRSADSSETRHRGSMASRWINTRPTCGTTCGPSKPDSSSKLSASAQPASRDPERGWQDAAAGDRRRGG